MQTQCMQLCARHMLERGLGRREQGRAARRVWEPVPGAITVILMEPCGRAVTY